MADALAALLGLADRMTDKSTTTTETGGKTVSAEGINALIKKQLESNQGLASITSGERQAGMYNSTVNTQLVNDLLTRVAGEAESQSTQTSRTTAHNTPASINPMGAALGLGGMLLMDKKNRDTAKEAIGGLASLLSSGAASSTAPFVTSDFGDALGSVGGFGFDSASEGFQLNPIDWLADIGTASPVSAADTVTAGTGIVDAIGGFFKNLFSW